MDSYYKDTDMSSDGLMVPPGDIKFHLDSINSKTMTIIPATWIDFFYKKDIPMVDISSEQDFDTVIFCYDSSNCRQFRLPVNKATVHGEFFLDTNDTVIAFTSDDLNSWVRISLIPEANEQRRNELLLAKTMLPTPIWMLMCLIDVDYETLYEEVLKYEEDLQ